MRVTLGLPLLLLSLIRSGCAADRVSTEDGRIVLKNSTGQKTQLTTTGLDSDPWISPDGRTVAFLRHSADNMFRTLVYEIDTRTRKPKLLYAGPAKYQGRESSYFGSPELNESHGTLFLLSHESATSGDLISIRLASGQIRFISDQVVGYDVIQCPKKYRGDLIALKRHEQDIVGHRFFLYWLYSEAGQELGLAGDGELDAESDFIRHGSCDEPKPPPSASVHPIPNSIRGAIRMDGRLMERYLVSRVQPMYPRQAQSGSIQGDVVFAVRVAPDGTVGEVNLVSGPPQLVEAAKAAVKEWRYRPVISSGHPVAVVTTVIVRFRLPLSDR